MSKRKQPAPDLGGRPPLVPGEGRVSVPISLTGRHVAKLDRLCDGNRSAFVRGLIDKCPEPRK